jgi:hypothetical protein
VSVLTEESERALFFDRMVGFLANISNFLLLTYMRYVEIFHRTIERSVKLEEEVAELKRDLKIWEKAYSDGAAASGKQVEEATALRKKGR